MERIKGKIKDITTKNGSNAKGPWTMTIVELEDGSKHSTFKEIPKDWTKGAEIEFDRKMNGDYSNIVFPSKTAEAAAEVVTEKLNPKFEELIKVLAMPRISVGFEKTIQENQYEPRKVSAHLTMNAESIDPEKIQAMLKLVESQVMSKIKNHTASTEKINDEIKKEMIIEGPPSETKKKSDLDAFM